MPNNIIELIIKAVDQFSGPSDKILGSVKKLAVGFTAAFSFAKIIHATKEAQEAVSLLGLTYSKSAESAKMSQKDIIAFSVASQKATIFSDTAVTKAQTTLLRFGRVTGPVFEQARGTILDVASALKVDLGSAAETVGRALQAPEKGMRQLRSIGVIFNDSQSKVIKKLVETGQTAKAQQIILDELSNTFSGAADVARNTLAGAADAVKNAFDSFFESSEEGATTLTDSMNQLADTLNDPSLKKNVQDLVGLIVEFFAVLVELINKAIEGWKFLFKLMSTEGSTALDKLFEKQSNLGAELQLQLDKIDKIRSNNINDPRTLRIANEQVDVLKGRIKDVQHEINILQGGNAGKSALNHHQLGDDARDFTPSATIAQEAQDKLDAYNAALEEMYKTINLVAEAPPLSESVAIPLVFAEGLEDMRGEMDDMFKDLEENVGDIPDEIDKALKKSDEAVKNFTDAFKNAFDDILNTGKFSIKQFVASLLLELGRKEIFKAIDKIGEALSKALSQKAGPSGGGGFWGSVATVVASFFGAAGGGLITKPTWVGEDGPELAVPMGSTKIFNARSLSSMGGSGLVYSPVTTIQIGSGAGGDQREKASTAAMFRNEMERNNAKQRNEIAVMLERNGFGRIR